MRELLATTASDQGFDDDAAVTEAIDFAFAQCGEDAEYELLEMVMLARLDDADKTGER